MFFGFLGFWSFGFLDFLCSTLVFSICRNSSKIGFGKNWRLHRNLQCFQGVCVSWGGDLFCIPLCAYTCISESIQLCVCLLVCLLRVICDQYMSSALRRQNCRGGQRGHACAIQLAVSINWGVLLKGVPIMRALRFRVYARTADFWKLPMQARRYGSFSKPDLTQPRLIFSLWHSNPSNRDQSISKHSVINRRLLKDKPSMHLSEAS